MIPSSAFWLLAATALWTQSGQLLALAFACLMVKRGRLIYRRLATLRRDLHLAWRMGRSMVYAKIWEARGWSVARIFVDRVAKRPDKVAIIDVYRRWTFRELEEYSNRVGRLFLQRGYAKGDCVALMMEGRGEYIGVWLGLAKIGVITALVNTNQRLATLSHSLKIVKAKAVVCGAEYAQAVVDIEDDLPGVGVFISGGDQLPDGFEDFDRALAEVGDRPLDEEIGRQRFKDKMLYIYTSGTTGLPKAAIITNARATFMIFGVQSIMQMTSEDVVYTPLPLYHSAGGLVGVGQVIFTGCTVVVRNRFSASKFWPDCIQYGCTISQYIGETCRYLLAVPPSESDRGHRVRAMYGNGLRPQIWERFVERFGIRLIGEFYGATEGNANLMNVWNKVGAVGYVPWFVKAVYPVRLVRMDEATKEPLRGPDGFCVRCETGEPGVLVGDIDPKRIVKNFSGYADEGATQKKILRDVFKKGDMYFNTGDILVEDEYNYFYFRDRTGDTFRWRGENISTSEVESAISDIIGLRDAIVYGVEIPNVEGKAGMAAILDEDGVLDLKRLAEGCRRCLQPVACPLFIRVLRKIPITGTFKLQKFGLQKEGYDISVVSDPLYFLDPRSRTYRPITRELYEDIVTNAVRL